MGSFDRYLPERLRGSAPALTPLARPIPAATLPLGLESDFDRYLPERLTGRAPAIEPEEPSLLDKSLGLVKEYATPAFAARIGSPIVGGVLGGIAGTALAGPGPGTAIGAALGAGLAGGGGELGAQALEGREQDLGEAGIAAGLSMIPAGPVARAIKPGMSLLTRGALHAGEGAAQSLLDTGATTLYREGRLPTAGELGGGAVAGSVLGGGLGLGLERAFRPPVLKTLDPDGQPISQPSVQPIVNQPVSNVQPQVPVDKTVSPMMAREIEKAVQPDPVPDMDFDLTPESVGPDGMPLQVVGESPSNVPPTQPQPLQGVSQPPAEGLPGQPVGAPTSQPSASGETPTFQTWVGNRLPPGDLPVYRALRAEYLETFPGADREQFRPQAAGPKAVAFEDSPSNAMSPEESARQMAEFEAKARELVPDDVVDEDLREVIRPAFAQPIKKAYGDSIKPELGLEHIDADRKAIVKAIDVDGDNPLYVQLKEARRMALLDKAETDAARAADRGEAYEDGTGDASFDPAEFDAPVGAAKFAVRKTEFPPGTPEREENFGRWFGGSRVVDGDGKPLRVFHGTQRDFDIFDADASRATDDGNAGRGFYFTSRPDIANAYSRGWADEDGSNIKPVYLSIKDPLHVSSKDTRALENAAKSLGVQAQPEWDGYRQVNPDWSREFTARAKAKGHDGVMFRAEGEYVAFSPEQIKSATGNRGTFDPSNPNIKYAVRPSPGQRGLMGISDDVPQRAEQPEKRNAQSSMFGQGALLQGVEARTTEGREAEGSLFTQEQRAREAQEQKAQDGIKFATKPTFYSALERAAEEAKVTSASGSDWLRYLSDPKRGVKQDEIRWTGLDDLLKSKPKATRQEVLDFIRENRVEVKEVELGSGQKPTAEQERAVTRWVGEQFPTDPNAVPAARAAARDAMGGNMESVGDLEAFGLPNELLAPFREYAGRGRGTKFGNYTLPGGENYRELLLTLPQRMKTEPDVPSSVPIQVRHSDIGNGRGDWHTIDGRGNWSETKYPTREAAEAAMRQAQGTPRTRQVPNESENFGSTHYDEPNILAHVRFNDRVDADGKRVLFIEEVQSDWAQRGRRQGFGPSRPAESDPHAAARAELERRDSEALNVIATDNPVAIGQRRAPAAERRAALARVDEAMRERERIANERDALPEPPQPKPEGVPSAPFVDSTEKWTGLALKRMLRYASENGYDRIAWTTGEQQAARYDLSKQVDSIRYRSDGEGTFEIAAVKGGETPLVEHGKTPKQLEDIVGKEIAQKIVNGEGTPQPGGGNVRALSGLDLKVGGEGMKGYYDKIIPEYLNKYGKKWGARVGETRIKTDNAPADVVARYADQPDHPFTKRQWATTHALDITPQMRSSVMEGQPQFRAGAEPTQSGSTGTQNGQAAKNQLAPEVVKRAFPSGNVKPQKDGSILVELPNGSRIRVNQNAEIVPDKATLLKDHPDAVDADGNLLPGMGITGAFNPVGRDGIISLAKVGGDEFTLRHESFHAAMHIALSPKERAAVLAKYGDEETASDAYAAWTPKTPNSWFSKIYAAFQRIYRSFRPSWESAFARTNSGEAFGKAAPENGNARFATRPLPNPQPETPDKKGEGFGQPQGEPDMAPNIGRMNVPDDVRGKAQTVLEDAQAGLKRETKQTWESLDPEVEKIQKTMSDAELVRLSEKRQLNSAEAMALKQRVDQKAREFDDALSSGDAKKIGSKALDMVASARALANDGTDVARALNARKRLMDAGTTVDDRFLRRVFKEIPSVTDTDAANLLTLYKTDPAKLPDALIAAMKPGILRRWINVWKAGLLSAPSTDVAQTIGNSAEAAANIVEGAISAGIDKVLSKRLGKPRERFLSEARAELSGLVESFGPAMKQLKNDMVDVHTLKPAKIDVDDPRPLEQQVGAFTGNLGKLTQTPYGRNTAEDRAFKSIGAHMALRKLALRKANGNEALAKQLIREAHEQGRHPDLIEAAGKIARERVFQDEPGQAIQYLDRMAREFPALEFVIPFRNTPERIAARTISRSPLGFVVGKNSTRNVLKQFKAGEATKGELADSIARPLLGTLILGGFSAAAQAGMMTGSGPVDQKQKAALRDSGWSPYSFKIPTGKGKHVYLPFNRFEPVSSLLGFAADLAESGNEKEAGDLVSKALNSLGSNLISKSYLQGLAEAAGVISRPDQALATYATDLVGSHVPNIIRRAATAIDPVVRDTKAERTGLAGLPERAAKTVASHIPGVSTLLPARKTMTGADMERSGAILGPLERFASPAITSSERDDKSVERLLAKIGGDALPSTPKKALTVRGKEVKLEDKEYEVLIAGNREATKIIERLMKQGQFQRLPDSDADANGRNSKEKLIESIFRRERTKARNRVFAMRSFKQRVSRA